MFPVRDSGTAFPWKPTHCKQRTWRTLTGGKIKSPSSEINSQSICLVADLVRPAAIPQTSTSTLTWPLTPALGSAPMGFSANHLDASSTISHFQPDILIAFFVCALKHVRRVAQWRFVWICIVTVDVFLPFRALNWEWASINNSPTNRLARLHVNKR